MKKVLWIPAGVCVAPGYTHPMKEKQVLILVILVILLVCAAYTVSRPRMVAPVDTELSYEEKLEVLSKLNQERPAPESPSEQDRALESLRDANEEAVAAGQKPLSDEEKRAILESL